MGISLEKAIEASVKGYIDDPDEISGIFTKLINMKADDFHCNLKENLLEWNKVLMEGYNVEVDRNKHTRKSVNRGRIMRTAELSLTTGLNLTSKETGVCLRKMGYVSGKC